MLAAAGGAADSHESVRQDPALQVRPELALHEARPAAAALAGMREEGFQVRSQHTMQDASL
jgi:hypothetical protein